MAELYGEGDAMSGTHSEPDRRTADRRTNIAGNNPHLEGDRRVLDRRHAHHGRSAPFPEEPVPLAAWLEAMLEHEISQAL